MRTLPLLIATGGGYFGYNRYERYKDRELEKLGIEVPPHLANELQVWLSLSFQLWFWTCRVYTYSLGTWLALRLVIQILLSIPRQSAFSTGSVCSIVE